MKKKISILLFIATLILIIFSFSTSSSSFATKKNANDEIETYSLNDSLPGFDNNKIYKNGEIISVDIVVNKYYLLGNDIPVEINHQITNGEDSFNVTLQLKSVVKLENNGYKAIYSK